MTLHVFCAPGPPMWSDGLETRYEALLSNSVDADGFETESAVPVESLLPDSLIRSEHHSVRELARCDGFTVAYLVESDFGRFEVEGTGLLRKRVNEIGVLAKLKEHDLEDGEVYSIATINAAAGPIEGAAQLLVHPVRTTTGIPRGMWSYARSVVEMTRGERTHLEDDYGEELVRFSEAKREWAYRLGVDPYSANPALQRALDHLGWLSFAGGMTARIPLAAVPGAASLALTITSTADDMRRTLRDMSPEDIRIDNRSRLRAMSVDADLVERFIRHPWYTPSRQLAIVEALDSLDRAAGRGRFVQVAITADEPGEAFFFTRMALVLAGFNHRENGIRVVLAPNGLVVASTTEGGIVLPLVLDLGLWTKSMMQFANAIGDSLAELRPIRWKRLLVSGFLSPRAHREFTSRGWDVTEGIEMTWLAEHDRKIFEPGRPDATRIIPEIGE